MGEVRYTLGRLVFMAGDEATAIKHFADAATAYENAVTGTGPETLFYIAPSFGELALRLIQARNTHRSARAGRF
jgi:hypothetical protein